ncbi:MAG TPA: flagellin, partial [Lacipirellulaceae bacterium]|nr:flagellin [Lacipirellulaceae bacterium]
MEQSLTRLSTGLRINTGKDDPAGLIASENLRSDITSIQKAISNTDRADQVIATADSGLGQVSGLLNDIRGLITEAANSGGSDADQIKANQLQIDQSLKALNQIAQTVTFQGRKLLDGSLDFITQAGTNFNQLSGLSIDQANLGATGALSVDVDVTAAATKASLNITGVNTSVDAANATTTFNVANNATQAAGSLTLDSEATGTLTLNSQTFNLTALNGGDAEAAEGNAVDNLAITFGSPAATSYDAGTHTLSVTVAAASGTATIQDVIDAINGGTDFAASLGSAVGTTTVSTGDDTSATFALSGGQDSISLTALAGGDAEGAEGNAVANLAITYGAVGAGTSYNASTHTLNVSVTQASGTATLGDIISAINGGTDFNA